MMKAKIYFFSSYARDIEEIRHPNTHQILYVFVLYGAC